jgi:hypothetical protein
MTLYRIKVWAITTVIVLVIATIVTITQKTKIKIKN